MASIGENYNNSTITALKALAIMAMVLGHAFVGTPIEKFVSLWHMPLFFFVSGFCFKEKYLVQPKEFLLKRLKGLLWPYIKFTFLFVALHNFLFELYLYDSIYSIDDIFKILRSVWIFGGGDLLLGGYWFLKVLFWCSMISYGWLYLTREKKNNIVIGICVFCLLLLINNYLRITVPVIRIASQEFASAILFLSGYLFSKNRVPLFSPVICLSSFCLLCLDYFCWSTHIAQPFFDNSKIFLYLVIAIMVIWSLYSMTFNLLNNYHLFSFIELVGNNTLTILTWHFLSFKVVSCVIIVYYELPVQKLSDFPIINDYISQWWNILYFISAIILTSGLACFNRYIKYSWLKL